MKRRRLTPERILDYLATINVPTPVRLVALTLYSSINGTDPSLQFLAWRSGMSVYRLTSYALPMLREIGFLSEFEGRMRLNVPEFQIPEIPKFEIDAKVEKTTDKVSEFLNLYKILWTKRYRRQCATTGRDRSKAFELIEEVGFEEIKTRLETFLRSDDSWLTERCHPLPVFLKTSNSYCRGSHGKAQTVKRSEDFDEEVRRFEAERRGED